MVCRWGGEGLRWRRVSEDMHTVLYTVPGPVESSASGSCKHGYHWHVLWNHCVGPDLEIAEVVQRENRNLTRWSLVTPGNQSCVLGISVSGGRHLRILYSFPFDAVMHFLTHLWNDPHVPLQRGLPVSPILSSLSSISYRPSPLCTSSVTLSKMANVSGPPFPHL